jgi:hypothetical protein
MNQNIILIDARPSKPTRPSSREDYFTRRRPDNLHGRLGFGGQKARLVGCEITQLSEAGAFVETYVPVADMPDIFTLEINGVYHRARRIWAEGQRLQLVFFTEELDYINEV